MWEKRKKKQKIKNPTRWKMKYIELIKKIEERKEDYISKKQLEKKFKEIYRKL